MESKKVIIRAMRKVKDAPGGRTTHFPSWMVHCKWWIFCLSTKCISHIKYRIQFTEYNKKLLKLYISFFREKLPVTVLVLHQPPFYEAPQRVGQDHQQLLLLQTPTPDTRQLNYPKIKNSFIALQAVCTVVTSEHNINNRIDGIEFNFLAFCSSLWRIW